MPEMPRPPRGSGSVPWLLAVVVILAAFTGTMLAIAVLRLLEVGL
jgi:hypothetical protein